MAAAGLTDMGKCLRPGEATQRLATAVRRGQDIRHLLEIHGAVMFVIKTAGGRLKIMNLSRADGGETSQTGRPTKVGAGRQNGVLVTKAGMKLQMRLGSTGGKGVHNPTSTPIVTVVVHVCLGR